MPRSYLYLPKKQLDLLFEKDIILADALILDLEAVKEISSNFNLFEGVFKKFKELSIAIYLKINSYNWKENDRLLKMIKGKYLDGWLICKPRKSLLNRLIIKVRDFELKNGLNFGSLNFILAIDSPEAVANYRDLANYERVKALLIDEAAFQNYLGWEGQRRNFVLKNISIDAALSKKTLISAPSEESENIISDLEEEYSYGATAKLTSKIGELEVINNYFTPSQEQIEKAQIIINQYQNTTRKERKKYIYGTGKITAYQLVRQQEILLRASRLGLINSYKEQSLMIKDEKVLPFNEIRPKKFYTIGEEIANSITHGVGVILSLIALVFLYLKGRQEGPKELFAYLVFGFSAFSLYLASTLYHGMPLGSRSKRFFQKIDHLNIYFLIAGTYTPITLLALGELGIILCIILWSAALVGSVLNIFYFGKFKALHMILYLAMGWIAVFYLKEITALLGARGTILLLAGGVSYTLGVLFYTLKLFKFTHMVWHIFTILGTVFHFLAIYLSL